MTPKISVPINEIPFCDFKLYNLAENVKEAYQQVSNCIYDPHQGAVCVCSKKFQQNERNYYENY